jgi:hypothetical protein
MTLIASGAISLGAVNTELGLSATAQISLNDAAVRSLFVVASGAIAFNSGYSKANWTPVTGNLSGASGTLGIHASQHASFSVSITGRGGYGGDNSWYDPGQAYIAPSGYVAAVAYAAGYYSNPGQDYIDPSGYVEGYYSNPGQDAIAPSGWIAGTPGYYSGGTWVVGTYTIDFTSNPSYAGLPAFCGTANTSASGYANAATQTIQEGMISGGNWYSISTTYRVSGAQYTAGTSGYYYYPGQAAIAPSGWVGAYYSNPGQAYIAPSGWVAAVAAANAYYTNSGQAYVAPSSGGGPYYITANNTTATVNGVTLTWPSGYGNVLGTSSAQAITAAGGQTLSFANPGGQTLSYSYSY